MPLPTIIRYKWNFGDGTIGYEKNPTHIYKMAGKYTVKQYLWDSLSEIWQVVKTYYITVYDYGYGVDGLNVSKTDRCLRFAVPQQPSQGFGWSLYDGSYWPYPEAVVGTNEVIDDLEERVPLVLDSRTFRTYRLGLEQNWMDGEFEYVAGAEIESEITFREHVPPAGANALLEHMQSHINIKPWFKDRRNTGQYGADGFRSAFGVDYYIKKDSSPNRFALTHEVPMNGQIVYDRNAKSEYLQQGVVITGAPWRLVSVDLRYQQIDSAGSPDKKNMTEMKYRDELSSPLAWFTRYRDDMTLNLATGIQASPALYSGLSTGPDGYAQSAITSPAAGNFVANPASSMTGNFAISVWIKNPALPIILFSDTTGSLVITLTAANAIQWVDGTNAETIALTDGFAAWSHIVVQRNGNNIEVFQNGVLVNTVMLTDSSITYGGLCTFMSGASSWFDFRLLSQALSDGTVQYVYNDLIENKGNAICPIF